VLASHDVRSANPEVDRDVLTGALKYMLQVSDYYYQWADELVGSIEGQPIKGLHARHSLLPAQLIEQCAKRHGLLDTCLKKCLDFSPYLYGLVELAQAHTNSLHKLASMSMVSAMTGQASFGDEEVGVFGGRQLHQAFDFFCTKLGWSLDIGGLPPVVNCQAFVDWMVEFLNTKGGTELDTVTVMVTVISVEKEEERLAMLAARDMALQDVYECVDQLYRGGRLPLPELFAQLARAVPPARGMPADSRLAWYHKLHRQVCKKVPCIDYVDVAGLLERGMVELRQHHDALAVWANTHSPSALGLTAAQLSEELVLGGSARLGSSSSSRRPSAAGGAGAAEALISTLPGVAGGISQTGSGFAALFVSG
jgi:hypothetical protein